MRSLHRLGPAGLATIRRPSKRGSFHAFVTVENGSILAIFDSSEIQQRGLEKQAAKPYAHAVEHPRRDAVASGDGAWSACINVEPIRKFIALLGESCSGPLGDVLERLTSFRAFRAGSATQGYSPAV